MKIIHRYLPREVGELLVRYLWLVLPFWQAIQSVVEKADQLSPFIWSDAIEKKVEKKETKGNDDRTDRTEGSGNRTDRTESSMDRMDRTDGLEPDFKTMHQSKQWTFERIQKII
jgi:hypothetical protein